MTFSPSIPLSGYAGWALLKRTLPAQTAALQNDAMQVRNEAHFRSKIGSVNTAEELVADRTLLSVALGAFGLENDINNKFFIQKILSDGTLRPDALSNRLADKQYRNFSAAFGFGDFSTPRNKLSDFPEKILGQYRARQFESAVGTQNPDLRLALNISRELPVLAAKSGSENSRWFTVMGNAPMRKVFETALSLPSSVGSLSIDQQLIMFKERAASQLGSESLRQFSDLSKVEKLVQRFLLKSEANGANTSSSGSQAALSLLQQRQRILRF